MGVWFRKIQSLNDFYKVFSTSLTCKIEAYLYVNIFTEVL